MKRRSIKVRIYPNKKQVDLLSKCSCGAEHIRDENAALNIKGRGTVLKTHGDTHIVGVNEVSNFY